MCKLKIMTHPTNDCFKGGERRANDLRKYIGRAKGCTQNLATKQLIDNQTP